MEEYIITDVVCPEHVVVYYDAEDSYADGGSAGSPAFEWIGIIQDVPQTYEAARRECRGIGSIDVNAIANGLQSPEINLKWIVQRKRSVATAFDPKTFMDYVDTFPTYGLGIGWEATYGSSYASFWYKGMHIDKLEVDFTIDSFIIASAKLVGQQVVDAATLIAAASRASNPLNLANSYALPLTGNDAEVFLNAAGSGDSALTNVKRVHFSIANNLKRVPVIQTSNADLLKYIIKQRRELTGEIEVYFEDKTEYAYCLDATALDIRIDLQKTDNTPYFDFTGCKLDRSRITTRINEIPCYVTLPFVATGLSVG